MNRKKRIILILSLSLLIFISICLSVGLIRQRQKNTNEVYMENTKTNNNSGVFAIMLETEAGSGVYEKSTTSTWPGDGYVFNVNLSSCENGGELSWNEELGAVNLKTNNTERCYVYFDKEPNIIYLADYIKNTVYQGDGVNGLYYHDGVGTYTNADQEAGDNSYRYSGANPNNYVCFGSDEEACLEDNLYRIIGVFGNEVKLIKADYTIAEMTGSGGDYCNSYSQATNYYRGNMNINNVASYYWDRNGTNTWSSSQLNSINLNQNYLSNIGNIWSSLIANHTWKVGGGSNANLSLSNAHTAYNYELGANSSSTTYNAKIGLMYVSDYYYGASNTYWTYPGYASTDLSGVNHDYRVAIDNNWMYLGLYEWTISRNSDTSNRPFFVDGTGYLGYSVFVYCVAIRPVFYLNSDVTYVSGDGSIDNPFRIE